MAIRAMRKPKTNAKQVRLDEKEDELTKVVKDRTGLGEAEIIRRALRFALPKFISKEADLLDYGPESK